MADVKLRPKLPAPRSDLFRIEDQPRLGWFFFFVRTNMFCLRTMPLTSRSGLSDHPITGSPDHPIPLAPPALRRFRALLLRWFDREKRTLPWRGERDPYRILVSEIILQQTRVAVVKERYQEFIRRFPTPQRLARAREQTVLAA